MNPLLLRCERQYFFQKEHGSHNTKKWWNFRHRAVPSVQRAHWRNFPDLPVVKTLRFHCREHRFDPWLGNKILLPHGQNKPRKFLELNLKNENTK